MGIRKYSSVKNDPRDKSHISLWGAGRRTGAGLAPIRFGLVWFRTGPVPGHRNGLVSGRLALASPAHVWKVPPHAHRVSTYKVSSKH